MIEFLSPAIFWALPLLSIPIILHFLKNIKPQKIAFSSIQFLKHLQKENLKKLVFLQYLLLLLRLLFMLFLIMTFAQPKWQSLSRLSLENKDVIIALDRSFSVYQNSAKTEPAILFKKLIIDLARSGDSQTSFHLLTNDGVSQVFEFEKINGMFEYFGEVHYFPGDIHSLLKKAVGLVNPARESIVLIFSDRQLYSDRDSSTFHSTWTDLQAKTNVYFTEFEYDEGEDNDGIINIENFRFGLKPSSHILMNITKSNNAPAEITFFDDRSRIAQKNLTKQKENVRIEMGNKKVIKGVAELEGDLLNEDNQFYWGIDLSDPGKILFCGDTSSLNALLAIATIEDFQQSIATKTISSQGLYGEVGKEWDWLFLAPQIWSSEYRQLVRQFKRDGTRIFIIPGTNADAFSEAIMDFTGRKAVLRVLTGNQQAGIKNNKFDSKLSSYPIRAFVQNYYEINSSALVRFDNNNPLIGNSRGIYFLTAPLNGDNGNIRLHPGLPIWFFNWLPLQSRINAFYPMLTVGEDTVITLSTAWKRYRQIQLSGPSGSYVLDNQNGTINLPGSYINKPGHFILESGSDQLTLAVNIEKKEFENNFYQADPKFILGDDYNASQTISLWKYFLLLAIFFLLIETIIRYRYKDFTE